jgi:NADH-quinone oxidoreductase subunit N
VDVIARWIKTLLVCSLWTCLYLGRPQQRITQADRSEFYVLSLFSLLGMMVMTSASHLLVLYLGLELFALPLYGMVVLSAPKVPEAPEAAIKYFVLGGVATAIML